MTRGRVIDRVQTATGEAVTADDQSVHLYSIEVELLMPGEFTRQTKLSEPPRSCVVTIFDSLHQCLFSAWWKINTLLCSSKAFSAPRKTFNSLLSVSTLQLQHFLYVGDIFCSSGRSGRYLYTRRYRTVGQSDDWWEDKWTIRKHEVKTSGKLAAYKLWYSDILVYRDNGTGTYWYIEIILLGHTGI